MIKHSMKKILELESKRLFLIFLSLIKIMQKKSKIINILIEEYTRNQNIMILNLVIILKG